MARTYLAALMAAALVAVLSGCGAQKTGPGAPAARGEDSQIQKQAEATQSSLSGKLVLKGSGSGVDVARKVSERFRKLHPNVTFEIPDSIGSSGGIKAVANGEADIGLSSRDLKAKERALGVKPVHIGSAPLVFVVHPSVKGVTGITRDQIVPIFSGQIKNWKELGGPDAPIIPILQAKGDSDRALLAKEIEGWAEMQDSPRAIIVKDSDEVGPVFTKTEYAITVIKYEDVRNGAVKGIPLKLDGVMVSETTTKSGKYSLGKPVYFVFRDEPEGLAKEFLDFVLSDEGQQIVARVGMVPIRQLD